MISQADENNEDLNKRAVELFDKHASGYEKKYMSVEQYSDSLLRYCAYLPKNAQVLELACGPGNITQFLLHHRPDLKILATDLSENMLDLARKNNPTAIVQSLDCRDIASLARKFDGIVAGFVLPYLSESEAGQFLGAIGDHLNTNGVAYLSWMHAPPSRSGWQNAGDDQLYMFYHLKERITELAGDAGLRVSDHFEYLIPEAEPDMKDCVLILRHTD